MSAPAAVVWLAEAASDHDGAAVIATVAIVTLAGYWFSIRRRPYTNCRHCAGSGTGVEIDRHRIRQTIPSQAVDGFPDWRRLFASLATKTPTGGEPTGFHPRFLTRFQTATCGEQVPLVIRTYGPREAAVITCGDWFAGAVMPMRLHDTAAEALGDWLTACQGTPDHTQEAAA